MSDIRFDYREDILFREYVLRHNDKKAWKEFCNLHSNRKVKYGKLFNFYKSIKAKGQKVAVFILLRDGNIYPLNGATRLGCLRATGKEHVKVKVITKEKMTRKWNHSFSLCSHHFTGLSPDTITKFKNFLADVYNYEY